METLRHVLVTGAASGIGAAVCRRIAGPGVHILAHTRRNRDGVETVCREIEAKGGTASAILSDLGAAGAGTALIREAVERLGGIDVLVANAGYALRTPLAKVEGAEFRAAQDMIAGSFFEMAQAAIPALRGSEAGRIVAVSAFGPHVWRTQTPTFPATAAAKASLEVLVRALALDLAADGITANAVAPGFIEKDSGAHRAMSPEALAANNAQIPAGRPGTAAEVAAVIAFLASPDASYVTGQVIHVNGGLV